MKSIVQLIVLVGFLCGSSFAQSITPLSNGVPVNGQVAKEDLVYFSVDSGATGGLILQVSQTSGTVYVFIGEDFVPSISNYTFSIVNNNAFKNFSVPIYTGTFYIAVYGYSSGSFQITGWGNMPVGQLLDGQIVTGAHNAGDSTLYFFDVPANSFDMLVIVQASAGDPDQYIYNQIPGPQTSPIWTNTGVSTTSCIFVPLPPAGRYYYVLRAAGNQAYTYSTAFYINHGSSCSFSKTQNVAVIN